MARTRKTDHAGGVRYAKEFEGRNLFLFFLIAFGWSWLTWVPGAVGTLTDNESLLRLISLQTEIPVGLVLVALLGITSPLGPLLGAFLVTYVSRGRDGVKRLWKRF